MKFTLRQLAVFLAAARQENLSRAAEALAMSPSAASDALRELENQFDLQLFDRAGKRLKINDIGRQLQPRAEELLSRAQELEQLLAAHEGIDTLKVGATLSIGNHLCIPLLQQYRQRYPQSQPHLVVANTEQISHMVANFELDVGLIEGEINNPQLDIHWWRHDKLILFCPPTHPLAARKHLSPQDLLAAQWILRERGSGTRQNFDRAMHDLLPRLDIVLELQQPEAIIQAVQAGMGLGCLSQVILQHALDDGSLVPLHAPGRDFARGFYLIRHKHKYQSAAIAHWQTLCLEYTN